VLCRWCSGCFDANALGCPGVFALPDTSCDDVSTTSPVQVCVLCVV
jgi:hypothetical protein